MQRNWRILESDPIEINRLSRTLDVSPLLAHLLVNRGISQPKEAEKFLNPHLSDLNNPFLFRDMVKAVERIKKAVLQKEKILVYGDYDVDGITGMAILIKTLKSLGGNPDFYIPHRLEEGYGISEEGIEFAVSNKINLIITVDCGVTNATQIEELKKYDIDVIITDHHEPVMESLPRSAYCVLDPLYPEETYPDKNLSGVGVAFKLSQAILGGLEEVEEMLDLVALGTVADVCILRGENRILVKYGLSKIGETRKAGIRALLEVAEINKKAISTNDVSFILGPRINAMGRLGSAELALRLFLTDSLSEAIEIAKTLNTMNRKRQGIETEIYNGAVNRIEREINFKNEYAIILGDERWHQGVLGIVASKLAERYSRPVILFSLKDKMANGSGRVNLENMNLFKLVDKCKHLMQSFGGHKAACGIKMKEELIPEFKAQINQAIREDIDEHAFTPISYIDAELNFEDISPKLCKEMEILAPFGEGNPLPTFISRRLKPKHYNFNGNRKFSTAWVTDGKWTYQAKGRGFLDWIPLMPSEAVFDLVYNLQIVKSRMGDDSICLRVQEFCPHDDRV